GFVISNRSLLRPARGGRLPSFFQDLEIEMTLQIHRLHGAILAALAASPLALAVAQDARAQDAEPAGQPTTLDRIEVTGSRIPRAEIENEQPIITISRAQIEEQGFNSVADILQN